MLEDLRRPPLAGVGFVRGVGHLEYLSWTWQGADIFHYRADAVFRSVRLELEVALDRGINLRQLAIASGVIDNDFPTRSPMRLLAV